jgi:hypothetical protein
MMIWIMTKPGAFGDDGEDAVNDESVEGSAEDDGESDTDV